MLDYIDKLNELDTSGVEPMSHVFPVTNVFREDVVTNRMSVTVSLQMRLSKRTARSRFQRPYRESDQEDRKNGIIRINRP